MPATVVIVLVANVEVDLVVAGAFVEVTEIPVTVVTALATVVAVMIGVER